MQFIPQSGNNKVTETVDETLSRCKMRPGLKKDWLKRIKVRHGSARLSWLSCTSSRERMFTLFPPLGRMKFTSHSRLSFLKNSSFSNLLLWSGTTRGILNVTCSILPTFVVLYSARETASSELPAKIPLALPSVFFFFTGWSVCRCAALIFALFCDRNF